MGFKFDFRLYQRGQTWRECLESWSVNRQDLLLRSKAGCTMGKTAAKLKALPRGTRFAVYYGQWSIDTVKLLPHLGKTLEEAPGVSCRFFSEEVFFPMMNGPFGRQVPKILLLDEEGWVRNSWGPRPESLTQEIRSSRRRGAQLDEWLLKYDEHLYLSTLDPSVATLLE